MAFWKIFPLRAPGFPSSSPPPVSWLCSSPVAVLSAGCTPFPQPGHWNFAKCCPKWWTRRSWRDNKGDAGTFVRRVQAGPCHAFFCRCPCDSWGQPLPCKLPSHVAHATLCHMHIPNLGSSRRLRVVEAGQLKLHCAREQSVTGRQRVYGRIFQLRAALQIFQLWKT